ncbi:hypothetical protein [Enterococcus sp. AZ103]|uniref:hypothetical protein n=1 Tax=Enterococcus sp. AZ103 TaxID=2774628 RepID=UPI003F228A15
MKVHSTVKMNTPVINRLAKAQVQALEMTTEALHTEIVQAQVVPFDKGTLQGEGFAPDYADSSRGRTSLVHSTPYARRVYFHPEYNFNTATNPNAKGKWLSDWMPGGKLAGFAPDAYKKFYRKITGV